jgi:RNA-directed DNA polymerase
VGQGALTLIVEPIFEATLYDGSYGSRPKRNAHAAVARVTTAILEGQTQGIDLDLAAYFDTVRHDLLVQKVAHRVQDAELRHVLTLMLTAAGQRGVPQGGWRRALCIPRQPSTLPPGDRAPGIVVLPGSVPDAH